MSIEAKLPMLLLAAVAAGFWGRAQAADIVDQACLDCHRDASDRGAIPIIEGQHYDYLRAQLQRFAEHHREGFPMNALAAGLDAEHAQALARALASRPWPVPEDAGSESSDASEDDGAAQPEPTAVGEIDRRQLAALDCAACHGPAYLGGGEIPRLAGQREDYLRRQIESFGEAQRHHPPVAGGARMYMIDAGEAAALAQALASLR